MVTFNYSPIKIALCIVIVVPMFLLGLWCIESTRSKVQFAGYVFMVLSPALLVIAVRMMIGPPALELKPGRISYFNVFGHMTVRPEEFRGYKVLKTKGSTTLTLDFGRGMFRNCNLSTKLLERKAGGLDGVLAALDAYYSDSTSRSEPARATAATHTEPAPAPVPGRRVSEFGRKGVT